MYVFTKIEGKLPPSLSFTYISTSPKTTLLLFIFTFKIMSILPTVSYFDVSVNP